MQKELKVSSTHSLGDFNPLLHVLSPKYEILSEDQKNELLQRFRVRPYSLPRILATDPAMKALEAKIGDIVKITHGSEISGQAVTYRLVVSE